ncbi:MAG: hypothetical protein KJ971_01690 [Firmicutes bacterium]|nr:hypothetical protein [Bacillota bacterium]
MKNLKNSFLNMMKNDKQKFIFVMIRITIAFLFFIGLFIPYIVGSMLVNNHVSLNQLPGATFYCILFFVTILIYFYFVLISKDKMAKKILLGQVIISSLIYVYGLLLYLVGLPEASVGFSLVFELLLIGLMWFMYFKEDMVSHILKKYIIKPVIINQSSVIEDQKPAVEEIAPIVEEKAPVVEEKAPIVEEIAPIVEEKAPVVEEEKPADKEPKTPAEKLDLTVEEKKLVE